MFTWRIKRGIELARYLVTVYPHRQVYRCDRAVHTHRAGRCLVSRCSSVGGWWWGWWWCLGEACCDIHWSLRQQQQQHYAPHTETGGSLVCRSANHRLGGVATAHAWILVTLRWINTCWLMSNIEHCSQLLLRCADRRTDRWTDYGCTGLNGSMWWWE